MNSAPLVPPTVTVPEACEALGVTGQTIRKWIRQGRLEAYRFRANQLRVTVASLQAFVEAARVDPTGGSAA